MQGVGDLLALLLAVMDNEVDTFWCFVGFMDTVVSRHSYLTLMGHLGRYMYQPQKLKMHAYKIAENPTPILISNSFTYPIHIRVDSGQIIPCIWVMECVINCTCTCTCTCRSITFEMSQAGMRIRLRQLRTQTTEGSAQPH